MKLGVTMPTRTVEPRRIPEYARWAEQAGFDSAWACELYRNPLTMLAICALATEVVELGTGLAVSASRGPFEMANAAADVDELSGGRTLLGIGSGMPQFVSAFHDTSPATTLTRVNEYVDVLRLSWQYLATGEAPDYTGQFHRFSPPPFNPWGVRYLQRAHIPIYLGAIGPRLLRLVGAKADGWLGHLATPELVREHVRPLIAVGADEAGREIADIDVVLELICVVSDDPELAMARARKQVGFSVVQPSNDLVVAHAGVTDEVEKLRAGLMTEGFPALERTSDKLVQTFSITGTPRQARARLADWEGIVDHLVFHTPYAPPLTAEESEDCYRNICGAFQR